MCRTARLGSAGEGRGFRTRSPRWTIPKRLFEATTWFECDWASSARDRSGPEQTDGALCRTSRRIRPVRRTPNRVCRLRTDPVAPETVGVLHYAPKRGLMSYETALSRRICCCRSDDGGNADALAQGGARVCDPCVQPLHRRRDPKRTGDSTRTSSACRSRRGQGATTAPDRAVPKSWRSCGRVRRRCRACSGQTPSTRLIVRLRNSTRSHSIAGLAENADEVDTMGR